MKVHELIKPNSSAAGAPEMTYPNFFQVKDLGGKKKWRVERVTIRDAKTGKVYGYRSVAQKNT